MINRLKIFFFFLLAIFLIGCTSSYKAHLEQAGQYNIQSEALFNKAIEEYETALKHTEDPKEIYFILGKLFYQHGQYKQAIEKLSLLDTFSAKKLLALTYYKIGDYTDALAIFNKIGEQLQDDEYLYYYGLTCEKHNLFDQAKKIYEKIKSPYYILLAKDRIQAINSLIKESGLELDPFIAKLIKDAPGQEDYPQAGAIILYCDEKIDINSDDSLAYEGHFLIKVLNERGKKYGEVEVGYDSTFEKLELIYAHTITPSGEVISVGKKHMRDVSKYLNFPLYSNARAMIISMPEVTEGAVIEYKIKRHRSQLVNKKDFFTVYSLQEEEPLMHAKFSVSLPSKHTLNIKVINKEFNYINANLNPQIKEEDDKKVFIWSFKDIPEIIPEPNMPAGIEITPTILLSTSNSWDEIYKWWWSLAKDKIVTDEQIKELVADLIKDKDDAEERTRSIYNWCVQNIRYVGIEYGQAGHEPHNAIEIFQNKYGDCKDQTVLLISMLEKAGIKAYPVLILTEGHFDLKEDFPMLIFNHCIAAAEIDNQMVFLDPTGETVSFGDLPRADQDRKVLVFLKDRWRILKTPLFIPAHNRTKVDMKITINDDESILAERDIFTFGCYDQAQRWWLKYTKPILYEEVLKEKIHKISPGSRLLDYEIDNIDNINEPIRLTYRFAGTEYLVKAGKARIISQLGDISLSVVAKDERQYNIDFGALDEKERHIQIILPAHLKVRFLPESIRYVTRWIEFVNQYNYSDNAINFSQKARLKKRVVRKEEYAEFKDVLEEISKKINQCIVLEELDLTHKEDEE